jgi:alkylated DNA repair dioxygenase AlkB
MMQYEAPNIRIVPLFFDDHEVLFRHLREGVNWDSSMTARKTASFGVPYNYSQIAYPEAPMPDILQPLIAKLADLLDITFNNCLLNYYETGNNSMGFHSDDTTGLEPGTGVAIVSLGSPRDISYRSKANPDNERAFTLEPGSLLYMDAVIQDRWTHAIKRQPEAGSRISLTWRAFCVV